MSFLNHARTSALAIALAAAGFSAASADELNIYSWSNYIPPKILEDFTKETGIKINVDTFADNEALLAKLKAGGAGYDVATPTDYMIPTLISEGLLMEIDAKQLPNFKNVAAPHDGPDFDKDRKYSAPYLWGTSGIAYDTAALGKLPESWKILFEPDSGLKGRIGMLDDSTAVYNAAAYYLKVDRCTEDPKEAGRIYDLLSKQKPDVAMYDSDGVVDRLLAGEIRMHMAWNGQAHRAWREKPNIVFVYPEEGISFWSDNLVVPHDAPHAEAAKTFINWMMTPERMAAVSNFAGYMNGLKGSSEFLEAHLRDDPAVNMPDALAGRLRSALECSSKARELRDRVWTRLKS